MTNRFNEWIQLARWSPSGGNSQPWRVRLQRSSSNTLVYIEIPETFENKASYADQWGAGSLIAIGNFAKTLEITAEYFGFTILQRIIYPNPQFWKSKIALFVKDNENKKLNLNLNIEKRITNRYPFQKDSISEKTIESIKIICEKENVGILDLSSDRKTLIKLYRELAFIRMHNKQLFYELMSEIYDNKNDPKRDEGLPFNTLGLNKIATTLLKGIKKLGIHLPQRFLNSNTVSESIDVPFTQCGNIFYLYSKNNLAEEWINIGFAFQEIFINLFSQGIALQPIAYNLIVFNHLLKPENSFLTTSESKDIEFLYQTAKQELKIDFKNPGIAFRVGIPTKQSPTSPRKEVEILFEDVNELV